MSGDTCFANVSEKVRGTVYMRDNLQVQCILAAQQTFLHVSTRSGCEMYIQVVGMLDCQRRSRVQISARTEIWFEISALPATLANSTMTSTLTTHWEDETAAGHLLS